MEGVRGYGVLLARTMRLALVRVIVFTMGGAPPVEHRSYLGPGGEPEIPSKHPPHPSVLVGGVGQRRRAP